MNPRLNIFKNRRIAIFATFSTLVLFGLVAIRELRIELLPDISFPSLTVVTVFENASPREIESLVTKKIEEAVSSVAGVERVESDSLQGVSLVTLRFAFGENMDDAAIQVREKVQLIQGALPEDTQKPVIQQFDPGSQPLLRLVVAPEAVEFSDLLYFVETNIKTPLQNIDGVGTVTVLGGLERQINVDLAGSKLKSFGLNISDVIEGLESSNYNYPAGNIREGDNEILLRSLGEFQRIEQIARTRVRYKNKISVQLGDVGEVKDDFRERTSVVLHNGREVVAVFIRKQDQANTVAVSRRVREAVERLNQKFAGKLRIKIVSDRSVYIQKSIFDVVVSGFLAIVVCYFALLFFVGDSRIPLIILASIPVSIAITLLFMHLKGVSANLISLGGLAVGVGLMVDSSTVVIDSIQENKRRGLSAPSAALQGTLEVLGSVIFSTATSCIVFFPVVFVGGLAGNLFADMALTVVFSLISSLVVAITLIPSLSTLSFFSGRNFEDEYADSRFQIIRNAVLTRVTLFYDRFLVFALERRKAVLKVVLLVLPLSFAVFLLVPGQLLPVSGQNEMIVEFAASGGTSLKTTVLAGNKILAEIKKSKMGLQTFALIGYEQDEITTNPVPDFGVNRGLIHVVLTDEYRAAMGLRNKLIQIGHNSGIKVVTKPAETLLSEILPSSAADLNIYVSGESLSEIGAFCESIKTALSADGGFKNVGTSFGGKMPVFTVSPDRRRLDKSGLTVQGIASVLRQSYQGTTATQYREGDRETDIFVRLRAEDRNGSDSLKNISIPVGEGQVLFLDRFFQVEYGYFSRKIQRFRGRRIGIITASSNFSTKRLMNERVERILSPFREDTRFAISTGEAQTEFRKSILRLASAGCLAIFLIYAVLAGQSENLVLPLAIMLSIPLVGIGAGGLLLLTGKSINITSCMGLIMLVGLVVNNAIELIEFCRRSEGDFDSVEELVRAAVQRRLRPILSTVSTSVFGLMPMALLGGGQSSMAVVVIGGLTVSTFLTLVLIPVGYVVIKGVKTDAVESPERDQEGMHV